MMPIATLKSVLRKIAADEIGIDQRYVVDDLLAPFKRSLQPINGRACIELNMEISTAEASRCRTFGEYFELVQSKR